MDINNWGEINFLIAVIAVTGMMVFPSFFFLHGFNQMNSLLKSENITNFRAIRSRAIKRSLIFLLIAFLAQAGMALVSSPEKVLNFVLTWQMFNLFALSALVVPLSFELACIIEKRMGGNVDQRQVLIVVQGMFSLLILLIFIISHDYSMTSEVATPVALDFIAILKHALLDDGTTPVIPWLVFSLTGGGLAAFFDLPSIKKNDFREKAFLIIITSSSCLIIGVWFLMNGVPFISAVLFYPASPSLIFIVLSLLMSCTTILILVIDMNEDLHLKTKKLLHPIISLSNISLTVFIIHQAAFALPPSIITTEVIFFVSFGLYSMFFVIISLFWQKAEYKWSLEWIMRKYS
ncbi:MAG: hypothetical protein ACXAEU_06940 [Candidatus Hodarchaeales archaeon]